MPPLASVVEREMRMESRPLVSRFSGLRVHFIGIGGCGMAGLARVLLDCGAVVSGSDTKLNLQTLQLTQLGATITREQTGQLLSPGIDLVVRTAAIGESNVEYQRAAALGLKQIKYAQLLGQVMRERLGIAVSGTHGKTTTTSMTAYALLQCGADPSFVIGGTVPQLGGSSHSGTGSAFVVEACEFDRSFHNYHPRVAIITNIEADHLDCYAGGLEEIIGSFRTFAERVPGDGLIIANGQDDNVRRALAEVAAPIEYLGLGEGLGSGGGCEWVARITGQERGRYQAQIFRKGRLAANLSLAVAGQHNIYNATAAIAACAAAGVEAAEAARALGGFQGVDRRMSEVGTYNHAVVVDDYGHHPTEIRTTLRALREKYLPERLICVFQPHQHSRTRYLLDDFAGSFVDADLTILPDIYAARDTDDDKRSVSTADLMERITRHGQRAIHLPEFPAILEYLRKESRPGDLIITMGAGNICDIGRQLVQE
jgi:UDP-N-acetylmuramate--alanine ligase